jgi:polysaccharide export outer membrane protein
MATMCRVIMARNRSTFSRGHLLLLGVALQFAMLRVPGNAQASGAGGGAPNPQPALSGASSAGKAAAAALGQGGGPTLVPADLSKLRIEPGDLLNVSVYDAPEFTNQYRVDPAGNLMLPLCGKVNLQGLTLPEAAQRLEAALKDGQIVNQPQVNVDLAQYVGRYVTVMGEVSIPGRVALIAPTLLSDVLAQAGGLTPLAGARIKIRHGDDDAAPEEDVPYSRSQGNQGTASVIVRPGDSVVVPRAGIVYVLGAVYKPGGYVMQEDGNLNVAEALALSGGTGLQANTGGLRVIRRNPDGTVLDFPLNYDAIAKGTQMPLALQPRDIVYVPMSKVKSVITSAQTIIGEAASAVIITRP